MNGPTSKYIMVLFQNTGEKKKIFQVARNLKEVT